MGSWVVAVPMFLLVMSALAADTPATSHKFELEMDVSGNGSNMTMGEPEIAVNPVKPNELYVDGAIFPVPLIFNGPSPVPDTCGGWSSENGGLSWQPAPLPVPICEDGEAVFGPDGTLYAGGDVATSTAVVPCSTPGSIHVGPACILVQGYDPVLRSTDGGHTWGAPVKVMGSTNIAPFPFAPGSGSPINTFDRPWLAVDQSTNTVYAVGHNIADHEAFVTASTDEAQSFGTIYAADSPAFPSGGLFGGTIAAAHGMLSVAYAATQAPGATCPCVIFETSTDHGATFTRQVVPTVNLASQPFPFVAADPTRKGHFALTVFDVTGTQNQIYTTDDSGKTWHGPTLVGEAPPNPRFKPWLTFGESGRLALVWRTWNGSPNTSSYDVWLAVGRDEGHQRAVFSEPFRVSSLAAPYPTQYGGGDDFSFVIATDKYVRVGWGDSRDVAVGGGVQIWIARIPLESFEEGRD
jgi:hypothetical protein